MTSEDRRQHERRLDDERCVDTLFTEGGFPDDPELRAMLLQLRELRVTEVPEPSPEVAALIGLPAEPMPGRRRRRLYPPLLPLFRTARLSLPYANGKPSRRAST